MKKRGVVLLILMMEAIAITFSSYAMEPRNISTAFLIDGHWQEANCEVMYQENLPEGWYYENDTIYYIKNGYPVSSLQTIDGKEYLFQSDGKLLAEGSEGYNFYFNLMEEMNQAKRERNKQWGFNACQMSEYEQMNLLNIYCIKYMPGIKDIGQSGFSFSNGLLSLNSNSDLDLENKITTFYNEFSGIAHLGDEEKAKYIHDIIIRLFDYDYSLTNMSDLLSDAFAYNNHIVCGGYAGIFKQVCDRYGLEAEIITGYGNGEYHAWNRVRINGKWKYIDCCWDDTSGTNDWLLKSKKEFDFTHIPD